MQGYLWFIGKRALQMLAVIFCGISATFLVTHLSPIDPVEQVLGRLSARDNLSPEAILATREAIVYLFCTGAPMHDQYINFWLRLVRCDLGPSLMAFPTTSMTIVSRVMPWTLGLFFSATLITFVIGN